MARLEAAPTPPCASALADYRCKMAMARNSLDLAEHGPADAFPFESIRHIAAAVDLLLALATRKSWP